MIKTCNRDEKPISSVDLRRIGNIIQPNNPVHVHPETQAYHVESISGLDNVSHHLQTPSDAAAQEIKSHICGLYQTLIGLLQKEEPEPLLDRPPRIAPSDSVGRLPHELPVVGGAAAGDPDEEPVPGPPDGIGQHVEQRGRFLCVGWDARREVEGGRAGVWQLMMGATKKEICSLCRRRHCRLRREEIWLGQRRIHQQNLEEFTAFGYEPEVFDKMSQRGRSW